MHDDDHGDDRVVAFDQTIDPADLPDREHFQRGDVTPIEAGRIDFLDPVEGVDGDVIGADHAVGWWMVGDPVDPDTFDL